MMGKLHLDKTRGLPGGALGSLEGVTRRGRKKDLVRCLPLISAPRHPARRPRPVCPSPPKALSVRAHPPTCSTRWCTSRVSTVPVTVSLFCSALLFSAPADHTVRTPTVTNGFRPLHSTGLFFQSWFFFPLPLFTQLSNLGLHFSAR